MKNIIDDGLYDNDQKRTLYVIGVCVLELIDWKGKSETFVSVGAI